MFTFATPLDFCVKRDAFNVFFIVLDLRLLLSGGVGKRFRFVYVVYHLPVRRVYQFRVIVDIHVCCLNSERMA